MKGKCKELCIAERKLRNKRTKRPRRRPYPPVDYAVISDSPRILRLRNGSQLRQPVAGVDVYVSQGGRAYTLTRYGLRPIRIQFLRRNNYGKKTVNGAKIGRRYPYILFRHIKYEMHVLMTLAWKRRRKIGEQIDHINGDIDDFRKSNLRVVTKEENIRCGRILKRLRATAIKRQDPSLNPINIEQRDLLEIFKRLKGKNLDTEFIKEVERYRTLITLRQASAYLHDPSINPDNMSHQRRNWILSHYRVDDPDRRMEYEMTHHMEI